MPSKDWYKQELERRAASANIGMGTNAKVRPFNWFENIRHPDAYARTYDNGTVAVNVPSTIKDGTLTETLAHELTHTKQPWRSPKQYIKDFFTPYDQIPIEKEAMAAEWNIPWKPKGRDTRLPYPDTGRIRDYVRRLKK